MERPCLIQLEYDLQSRTDTATLCIPLDMRSDVISHAAESPLGGDQQGAENITVAIASWLLLPQLTQSR